MMTVRELSSLSDLRDSGFGWPPPRHGLNLLWWFACKCVLINNNKQMSALCDPSNGDYGFRRFQNREQLLPISALFYYEIGNLHNSSFLPSYVTENYTHFTDESNCDRIIVSYNSITNKFVSVYVTRHSGMKRFDQNKTFQVLPELLEKIKSLKREDIYNERKSPAEDVRVEIPLEEQWNRIPVMARNMPLEEEDYTSQIICCVAVVIIIALALGLYFGLLHKE